VGDIFITDMTHFGGISPGPSHEPAKRIAQFFGAIVSAASVSPADVLVESALFCRIVAARTDFTKRRIVHMTAAGQSTCVPV